MSGLAAQFAQAAENLLGTPFRLHGRDRETGLDCVGLLIVALQEIGEMPGNPSGYRLRSRDFSALLHHFPQAGFGESMDNQQPGDVIQVIPGPGQLHFLVVSPQRDFIHAHAGLGKVVRTPPPLSWPVDRLWRLANIRKA